MGPRIEATADGFLTAFLGRPCNVFLSIASNSMLSARRVCVAAGSGGMPDGRGRSLTTARRTTPSRPCPRKPHGSHRAAQPSPVHAADEVVAGRRGAGGAAGRGSGTSPWATGPHHAGSQHFPPGGLSSFATSTEDLGSSKRSPASPCSG
jgi:hypothetical protein